MRKQPENEVADAIALLAQQVKYLGNGDAATRMGAIEALGAVHKEGFLDLSVSIDRHREAMEEVASALNRIADAIANKERE